MKSLVLIAAKDEAGTVGPIVAAVRDIGHVLVIVNPSNDGAATAKVAHDNGAEVLENDSDLNIGGSLMQGYAYAMDHDYECLTQMDAGGSHSAADALRIFEAGIKRSSTVIGSRLGESAIFDQKWRRRCLTRFAGWLGRKAVGVRMDAADKPVWPDGYACDFTSGLRFYPFTAFRYLALYPFEEKGHVFNWVTAVRLAQAGYPLDWIPITYVAGRSSASFESLWEATWSAIAAIGS